MQVKYIKALRVCLKNFKEVIFTTQVALTLNELSQHK